MEKQSLRSYENLLKRAFKDANIVDPFNLANQEVFNQNSDSYGIDLIFGISASIRYIANKNSTPISLKKELEDLDKKLWTNTQQKWGYLQHIGFISHPDLIALENRFPGKAELSIIIEYIHTIFDKIGIVDL